MPVNCLRYAAWTLSLLYAAFSTAPAMAASGDAAPAGSERLSLGLRGVYFVPNQGQWSDGEVHYGLRSRGLDVAFRDSSLTMHMAREVNEPSFAASGDKGSAPSRILALPTNELSSEVPFESSAPALEHLTLTLTFPGSNDVQPQGADPQSARFNYFVGGEGRGSASNVPSFGAVIYENLYDGIDLHVMGNDAGILKYEFHVAPGADWSQIAIAYDGIDSLCIDDAGDLQINTTFGTLTDAAPLVWQGDAGSGAIPARFELVDDQIYRIALDGPVDPTRELIIDPDVEWMRYLGGSGGEESKGIALDAQGNAVVSGHTRSATFEGRTNSLHGGSDAYVLKVASAGDLLWMTYLGGIGEDSGQDVAIDNAGNILVAGSTTSTDFEGRNNTSRGSYDVFILSVSAAGEIQWMSYLGGSGVDHGLGLALDGSGNILVAGTTQSTDFEGRNNSYHGGMDAFLARIDPASQLQWMTYLGGSADDFGRCVSVDSGGSAIVAGATRSSDFEGRTNDLHGLDDAFSVKVNPAGARQWMTYLGGSRSETGYGIAVDAADIVFITGFTESPDFEVRTNSFRGTWDAIVVQVSADGLAQRMTYFGGSGRDVGQGIAIGEQGDIFVTGYTSSTNFEGQTNTHRGGMDDVFVFRSKADGLIQWMIYLGGVGPGGDLFEEGGYDIALNGAESAYAVGMTFSPNFLGQINAYHGADAYYGDGFIVKLNSISNPQLNVSATCPSGGPIQVSWTGATSGGTIVLIAARNRGSFTIPIGNPCAGTAFGLGADQIQIVFQGNAGANGSRILNSTADPAACDRYLQLLDLTTCSVSNVVRIN